MSQKGNSQANFRVFNLDSEDEIDFESSISNNEEADSKQFIIYSKDEEMKCFQGPTELIVLGIEQKQLSNIGHQKYKNKNFPTLSLKKFIAFFKCFPRSQQEQYRGFMELLQEKARMKREKKQVSFAKRHHIKLNKCPASAQLYCSFLQNYLMPAFKQSRKIQDLRTLHRQISCLIIQGLKRMIFIKPSILKFSIFFFFKSLFQFESLFQIKWIIIQKRRFYRITKSLSWLIMINQRRGNIA